jgi:hypothetical protein
LSTEKIRMIGIAEHSFMASITLISTRQLHHSSASGETAGSLDRLMTNVRIWLM